MIHNDKSMLAIIDGTPLVSIDLIIRNSKGEVLLGKRVNRPARGYWFVPGGRIMKNERIESAIRRISRNELGFEVLLSQARLLGAYDHIYQDNFLGVEGINTHYVVLGFGYDAGDGQAVRPDDQHSAIKWWPVTALLGSPEVHSNTRAYFETRSGTAEKRAGK
jgi:colanic acid biosynthesis protein WcaH